MCCPHTSHNRKPSKANYRKGGIAMKDSTTINRFRVSDKVLIVAIETLGKVLLALITSGAAREE